MLEPQPQRVDEREEQRAEDAPADAPAPEDDERDAHPAAPRDDVEREAAEHRERQEGAADGHQRAADHQRQVADPRDARCRPRRPPPGSRRPRGSTSPKRRPLEQPPRDRHDDEERDVRQAVLAERSRRPRRGRRAGSSARIGVDALELAALEASAGCANSDRPMRTIVRPSPTRAGWRRGSRSGGP